MKHGSFLAVFLLLASVAYLANGDRWNQESQQPLTDWQVSLLAQDLVSFILKYKQKLFCSGKYSEQVFFLTDTLGIFYKTGILGVFFVLFHWSYKSCKRIMQEKNHPCCTKIVQSYPFLSNFTSEGAVSHNVLYYQRLPVAHYQVS